VELAVLLGLSALWIAVLLPDFLRRRGTRRSGDSMASFNRHLSILERSNEGSGYSGSIGSSSASGGNVISLAMRRRAKRAATLPMMSPVETTPARSRAPQTRQAESRHAQSRQGTAQPQQRAAQPARPQQLRTSRVAPAAAQRAKAEPEEPTRRTSHHRRQEILVGLGAAALLTFLATISFGGVWLAVHLLVDLIFVGYLGLVLMFTRSQPVSKVTYLPQTAPVQAAPYEQRRTAAR
jgi:hypothetical protein